MQKFKSYLASDRAAADFGFVMIIGLVVTMIMMFGYQEAEHKKHLAAIKQHYIDHPDEKRLVFNCVNPKTYVIDCSKPWLKKNS